MYQFAKDFLGPVATLVAAFTATGITIYFYRIQALVARRQAETARRAVDIAHDRLRFDLFDKRYKIYTATKDLLRTVINDHHKDDFSVFAVVPYYIIMDEAPFFFPEDICKLISLIQEKVQDFVTANAARQSSNAGDRAAWIASANELAKKEKSLMDTLRNVHQVFALVLSFPQLTGSGR